ncbi:MAG: hypothetical protein IKV88_08750 [Clostridia bacterium]|nr:hypothetical protein [Clostridia bacterium]
MKKLRTILCLTLCLLQIAQFPLISNAHNIGDIINETVYTDIIASINQYNIASYNINGYTAVVAEDLRNYGFDVQWNPDERSLYISRASTNDITSVYIAPQISKSMIGTKAQSVLYTDIKTYINNKEVTSYNIDGKTIIYFNDLATFGNVSYSDYTRRLDLSINDGLKYKISSPTDSGLLYAKHGGIYFKRNSVDGIKVRWMAYANTNKTIKYYTTTYVMYNSVNEPVRDSISSPTFSIQTVGPLKSGQALHNCTGDTPEEYSESVKTILLHTIYLEYVDGTSEIIYYNYPGTEAKGIYPV